MTKENVRRQLEHHSSWKLLNQIATTGEATKQLISILPEETVSTILRVFRELKRLSEIMDYDKLLKKDQWPITALKNIRQELKNLHRQGFLYVNDAGDIMTSIEERIKQGPKQIMMLQAIGKERIRKAERITKPPDIALNMTVCLLAEHLKAKTSKWQWGLIYDFLIEQQIIEDDAGKTGSVIEHRYKKIDKKKLQAQYQNYRNLWLYPERNIKRTITGTYQEMIHLRDITLPEWTELLP